MNFSTFVKRSGALVLLAAALGGSAMAMHSVDTTQDVKASQPVQDLYRVQALYADFVHHSSLCRNVAPVVQKRMLQQAMQGFLRHERYQGLTSQECAAFQALVNATSGLVPVVKQVVRNEFVHYPVSDRKDPMAFKAQGPTLALAVRDQQSSVSAVPSFSSSTSVDATAKTVATTVVKPMPLPVVEAKSSVNTNKVKVPNRRLTYTNLRAKNTLEKAKLIADTDFKGSRVAVKAAVKQLTKPMPRVSSTTVKSAPSVVQAETIILKAGDKSQAEISMNLLRGRCSAANLQQMVDTFNRTPVLSNDRQLCAFVQCLENPAILLSVEDLHCKERGLTRDDINALDNAFKYFNMYQDDSFAEVLKDARSQVTNYRFDDNLLYDQDDQATTASNAPVSMSALSSSSAHSSMCGSDSSPCSAVAVDTKRPSCCARMMNACYNVSAYPLGVAWNVTKKTLGLGWDVTRWAAVNAYATLKYGVPLALVYRWYLPAINKVLANADPNMSQAAGVVYLAAVLGIPRWLAKKWYDRAQAA